MIPKTVDLESLLDKAFLAHRSLDPGGAEQLCRAILRVDPDHAEALNLLGVVLQNLGRVDESVAALSRAIEIDPEFPDAHSNLARALRFHGQEGPAAAAARRATELDPELGEAWQHLGFALITLGQSAEGLAALREAVARAPDAVDLHVGIGVAAQSLGDHEAAAAAWREVLRLQPNRIDAMVNLSIALTGMERLDEALALQRRALEHVPGDMIALAALAKTLHVRFEGEELVKVCRQILDREPGRLDTLGLLASGLLWLGQFDDAKAVCQEALVSHPNELWFSQLMSSVIPGMVAQDELAKYRAQLEDENLPINERVPAGYALGAALDRASEYDAAFEVFQTTNGLFHAAQKTANESFNLAELQTYVENAHSLFSPAVFHALRPFGNPSELPVFIVGMPRSGTSLVEQIAATHSLVFGGGERRDIVEILMRLNRDQGFGSPLHWDPRQIREEAGNHVARMSERSGGADRYIDKLPDNIQMLGQIRVLFPNARIIVCRRDPRDVGLSCFTTHFGANLAWAYDLEDIAARAMEIERLTRHWLSVIPGPILEIQYETLVRNLEPESRRLIAFLGLEWEPACLEFHKTKRQVTTASTWQVRQPLYESSIGRWRHYEAHLGPMLRILARTNPGPAHAAEMPEAELDAGGSQPPSSNGAVRGPVTPA